ncbi:hypothetical protein HYH03_011047 [Edaphochlamys debaryana]|uniref:Uncharacterized protein n=1 Tax=Edaphochlamys debaryana TaxID=47281 RepID=A0A836BX02_9CHLO|nr:hypothetical protein HYH03_011047 [Edaphochlamys debaryana]|eukprot:KAG2490659.1 hypothetical protein HYH03_011047 [Edaphochlamys debaryana]
MRQAWREASRRRAAAVAAAAAAAAASSAGSAAQADDTASGDGPRKPRLRLMLWAVASRLVLARRWLLLVLGLELVLAKGAYLLVATQHLQPWQAAVAILVASAATLLPDAALMTAAAEAEDERRREAAAALEAAVAAAAGPCGSLATTGEDTFVGRSTRCGSCTAPIGSSSRSSLELGPVPVPIACCVGGGSGGLAAAVDNASPSCTLDLDSEPYTCCSTTHTGWACHPAVVAAPIAALAAGPLAAAVPAAAQAFAGHGALADGDADGFLEVPSRDSPSSAPAAAPPPAATAAATAAASAADVKTKPAGTARTGAAAAAPAAMLTTVPAATRATPVAALATAPAPRFGPAAATYAPAAAVTTGPNVPAATRLPPAASTQVLPDVCAAATPLSVIPTTPPAPITTVNCASPAITGAAAPRPAATVISSRRLPVRSLLVRRTPAAAAVTGSATAAAGPIGAAIASAASAADALLLRGAAYRPVTRARLVSVKVHAHPGSFLDYAPSAADRIQAYLAANPLAAAAAASGTGGAADGGAEPAAVCVKTLAVPGCVQILSWAHWLPEDGFGDGDGAWHGGDGGSGDLAGALVRQLPGGGDLAAVDVDTDGAVVSYRRDAAAAAGDESLVPMAGAAAAGAVEAWIHWVRPPFLAAGIGAAGVVSLDVCLGIQPAAGRAAGAAASSTTVVRILLVATVGGGSGPDGDADTDPYAGGGHVVLDEHLTVECGAASVVRLELPAAAVAEPGVFRLVVSAPARFAAVDGGSGGGGSSQLILASATLLCLPPDVAAELCALADGAAADGGDDVDVSDDVMYHVYDNDDGIRQFWERLAAPLTADIAFLAECAAAATTTHAAAVTAPPAGPVPAAAGTAAAAAARSAAPMFVAAAPSWAAGRAALVGLVAVEDSLRAALEPLGAPTTIAYVSRLSRAAAAAVVGPGFAPLPGQRGSPPPPQPLRLRLPPRDAPSPIFGPTAAAASSPYAPYRSLYASPAAGDDVVTPLRRSLDLPSPMAAAVAGGVAIGVGGVASGGAGGRGASNESLRSVLRPLTPGPPSRQHRPAGRSQSDRVSTGSGRHLGSTAASGGGSTATGDWTDAEADIPDGGDKDTLPPPLSGADAAPPSPLAPPPPPAPSAAELALLKKTDGDGDSRMLTAAQYAASILSSRRRLLMSPLTGFKFVPATVTDPSAKPAAALKISPPSSPGGGEGGGGGGSSSGGSQSRLPGGGRRRQAGAGADGTTLERQYELYCNRLYTGPDQAAFLLLLIMFGVVTWRKLLLPTAWAYNLTCLWLVASTLMAPYVVQAAAGWRRSDVYLRNRERLMLGCQVLNGIIYGVFAARLMPMPSEMTFHWNHSHVLQRGLVRPVRRPVRFATHALMLALEVLTVTPAFLSFSGWKRTMATTAVTYTLSAAVGYGMDLAMRRVFLLSLARAGGGGGGGGGASALGRTGGGSGAVVAGGGGSTQRC